MNDYVDFRRNAEHALGNSKLQANLEYSLSLTNEKRVRMVDTFPDWEEMRTRAARIRSHVIENLDEQLLTFSENAEQKGFELRWAKDAQSAREMIAEILFDHKIRTVVKSKSMLTEEIELNDFLTARGITPVETDLGEYIAQLAGEKPSHITAPIIHLSRRDVAAIMNAKLGINYTESPEELTAAARRILRSAFLTAGAGISGVNFGLIREGSLVIVENEGNVRLSTSLPPVHIAVMGIERLIPALTDLPLFLSLLTVSATGQRITNYVSVINGPRKKTEKDGPEKVYIVLVDNGRSDILENVKYRSMLTCIRCGACMNSCPVYRKVGGHAYGSVYPGPMGAILSPLLFSQSRYRDLPYASTLCGACSEVCPVKIPLHHMLLDLRADAVRSGARPIFERVLFTLYSHVAGRPGLYRMMERIIRLIQPMLQASDKGLFVPGWSRTRYFQPLSPKSFYTRMQSDNGIHHEIK